MVLGVGSILLVRLTTPRRGLIRSFLLSAPGDGREDEAIA